MVVADEAQVLSDSYGSDSEDGSVSDDDFELSVNHHFVMVDEMLERGLELLGYTSKQLLSAKHDQNLFRFKCAFGASPNSLCSIYEDLQTAPPVAAEKIVGNDTSLKWFLISFHFLRKYPTDMKREYIFNVSMRHS